MFSLIHLRLEEVPLPSPRIELGARSVSAFYDLPPHFPFPLPNVVPEKETCEFQFQIDAGKFDLGNLTNWIWAICIKHTLDSNLTKKTHYFKRKYSGNHYVKEFMT